MKLKSTLLLVILSITIQAKINIVSSILPIQSFTQAIGGDKISVALMVKPGNSPHTYEPKPSQMRDISRADIYMAIGVEFENVWLPRFTSQNTHMKTIDLTKNIEKLAISGGHGKVDEHHDPHIWTNPANAKLIAKNILEALLKIDNKNKIYYQANYTKLIKKIEETDKAIAKILYSVPNDQKSFIVFHPSWGYFAKRYHLKQIPIEIDGKSPKPRDIQKLIKLAKKLKIHSILTSPEFSDAIAQQIASELDIKVIKISPLSPNWAENLVRLARGIAHH